MEAIIFDFDGVIVENFNIKSDAFGELYSSYSPEIIKKILDFHKKNGGMSRYEKIKYFHEKIINKPVTIKEIEIQVNKLSEIILSKIPSFILVKGIKDFIEKYQKRYKMFISSGTPELELIKTVEKIGLKTFFMGIYGSPKTKIEHIEQILEEHYLFPQQVVFIGDAKRDKESAQAFGLNFIARISNNKSPLINEKYKILDFTDIEKVIETIDVSNLIV